MPSCPYFSAFCFASFRISSATWRSRSSSVTVGASEVPICARTRLETTVEREDPDMVVHSACPSGSQCSDSHSRIRCHQEGRFAPVWFQWQTGHLRTG